MIYKLAKVSLYPVLLVNKKTHMKKEKTQIAMALYDVHVPYQDETTIDIFCQIAKDIQPEHIVYGGDMIDCEALGRWTKETVEDGIYQTLEELLDFRNLVHDKVNEAAPNSKYYWTLGNHEFRLQEAIKDNPNRDKIIDLPNMFTGIKFCNYNDHIKIGKLYFTHGIFHNDAHAKKHVLTYGANVLYGHLHTEQVYTMVTRGRGKAYKATSIPCACTLNPSYMKNKPNSWTNGFAIIYFDKQGHHWINIVQVINGKAIFNNKIYESTRISNKHVK